MNRKSRRATKAGGKARKGVRTKLAPPIMEAIRLLDAGEFDQAETLYRQCLATMPGIAEIHYGLGIIALRRKRYEDAVIANAKALDLDPKFAAAANHLGVALKSLGRHGAAEEAFRRATEIKPYLAAALNNLGNLFREVERFAEAEAPLREAIGLDPKLLGARVNLSDVLRGLGRYKDAETIARETLMLAPENADAYNNLGNALRHQGRIGEAAAAYEKALALAPEVSMLLNNLANAYRDLGRIDEAIATYRKAIDKAPQFADGHSSLIFALDFDPKQSTESQQLERDRWWAMHGAPRAAAIPRHDNVADPERRLRVGYVTAHFRRASSASAFGPVIFNHDPARFGSATSPRISAGRRRRALSVR